MRSSRLQWSTHSLAVIAISTFVAANAPKVAAQESGSNPPETPKLETPPELPTPVTIGIEAPAPSADGQATTENRSSQPSREREEKFAKFMSGASLKGRFTILGMKEKMPEETYTIAKCEKLAEGNLYRFTARIQYGDTDTELPMDIPVEWAGDTPVISLTKMWLPGLGTFSARVLIYGDSYAGTWSHDEVGGHMFGVIVKNDAKQSSGDASPEPTESKPAVSKTPSSASPDKE